MPTITMSLNAIHDLLPGLAAPPSNPAWLGFIPVPDGDYFQYTYHDAQFRFEYMLFPEEELASSEAVKRASERHGLQLQVVDLDAESYLTAPLGLDAAQAALAGLRIV